ncbi:protein FAM221B [Cricetulus griseus]|uniref:Protein FAM221B n=1 Tax=Cricetulus griseus TaxID=10029 RepID=A0A9J7GND2_CRIGR|nr:protein FAM221B [Cricetulus griseus]
MEANEIAEGPQATEDAKRPSLKDPSAEDLKEPTTPEPALELSSSQTTLQPPEYKVLFVTSTSPNQTEAPEGLQESSLSESPSKSYEAKDSSQESLKAQLPESHSKSSQSVTSLEKTTSETPLESPADEIYISKVQKSSLGSSQTDNIPSSSPSPHKISFDEAPQTQVPKYELYPQHPFSGPSTQANVDTSAEQEEAKEDELIAGTSDGTAHAASPESHGSKKKEKRVSGYTSRPVVPAKRADLVKAMHREQFGAQMNNLFQWEKDPALKAIQTGLYIGWRCPHYLWDCFRIGDESKCFCGHLFKEHQIISDLSAPCSVSQCRCLMFCFIPSRPEEVGEFWLKRRSTFDPKAWRAQCRCKHTHEEHAATGAHPCRHHGCCCNCFESNFLCAACDRRWEEHETFFETEETRRRGGRPYGEGTTWDRTMPASVIRRPYRKALPPSLILFRCYIPSPPHIPCLHCLPSPEADYVPFAEMPALRDVILTNSDLEALQRQGVSGQPSSHPRSPALPGPSSLQPGPKPDPHT